MWNVLFISYFTLYYTYVYVNKMMLAMSISLVLTSKFGYCPLILS